MSLTKDTEVLAPRSQRTGMSRALQAGVGGPGERTVRSGAEARSAGQNCGQDYGQDRGPPRARLACVLFIRVPGRVVLPRLGLASL